MKGRIIIIDEETKTANYTDQAKGSF